MASGLTRTEQYALIGVVGLIAIGVAFHAWRRQAPEPLAVSAGQGRWEKLGEVDADGRGTIDGAKLDVASPRDYVIDLNAASLTELDRLPGIGPVKARAIIETRDRLGGFKTIEQLDEVKGIGPVTIEKLRPRLKIGTPPRAPSPTPTPDDPKFHQPAGLIE
ncbi:MAG: helix-hairpin-helix domain-containing protein [Candidatus Sumerlaeia bacterium]